MNGLRGRWRETRRLEVESVEIVDDFSRDFADPVFEFRIGTAIVRREERDHNWAGVRVHNSDVVRDVGRTVALEGESERVDGAGGKRIVYRS